MRLVYFRSGPAFHSAFRDIIDFPPEGYQFVRANGTRAEQAATVAGMKTFLNSGLGVIKPYVFSAAYYMALWTGMPALSDVPPQSDIVFSPHSLLPTCTKPWVVSAEHVGDLFPLMYDFHHVNLYTALVKRIISSPLCKAVLPWTYAGADSIFRALGEGEYRKKLKPVHLAVRPRPFIQRGKCEECRILFVNTANFIPARLEDPRIIGEQTNYFYTKGGVDLLDAYSVLVKKYDHVKLILRSYVPPEIVDSYSELVSSEKLVVFKELLPESKLEELYATSHIFAYPANLTPAMAIIEAMSFGLPVVATDYWANTEMVANEKTGLVIAKRKGINNITSFGMPNIKDKTGTVQEALRKKDERFVDELARSLARLIEDDSLRMQLGANAWKETQEGEFSIRTRNERLREVFDKALL